MKPAPFPWERVIGFALGVLRLPPDAFWRMTPRELAFAIGATAVASPAIGRSEFESMMMRYPDGRR